MSLYNLMRGTHPLNDLWLHLLDVEEEDFCRFRDAWVENTTGELRIVVLTRCGGGNRPDYGEVFDKMREHPEYIENRDIDYDPTYAAFIFNLPEEFRHQVDPLLEDIRKTPGAIDAVIDNRSFQEIFEEGLQNVKTALIEHPENDVSKPPSTVIMGDIIGGSENISFKGASSRNAKFHTMTIGNRRYKIPVGGEVGLEIKEGVVKLDGVEVEPEEEPQG